MWLEYYHSISRIWSASQHCGQEGHRILCHNWQHATLKSWFDFTKMSSHFLGKKGEWVYYKHLYCVFRILCKVDHGSDKFIHAPTYSYNKVMQLLELVGVVECEYYTKCCIQPHV